MAKENEKPVFKKSDDDRVVILAKEIYVAAVAAGKQATSDLNFIASEAIKQSSAFWSVVDERRPQL